MVLVHQKPKLVKQRRPLGAAGVETPLGIECFLRDLDSPVDVGLGCLIDLGDQLAVGGVDNTVRSLDSVALVRHAHILECAAARAFGELAADEDTSGEGHFAIENGGVEFGGESRGHDGGWEGTVTEKARALYGLALLGEQSITSPGHGCLPERDVRNFQLAPNLCSTESHFRAVAADSIINMGSPISNAPTKEARAYQNLLWTAGPHERSLRNAGIT